MNRGKFAASAAAPGCVLGAALSAAILPSAALAEDGYAEEARDRPEIVVIGEHEPEANPNANPEAPYKVERSQNGKFTEPLRDTPKSVTVIPKELMEDIGATSFRDIVRSTPGVTLGTGEGGIAFGDRIFIRGFEARNDVYVDGLRDPGVSSREIFAVEQIEIVKGPSGSFGGRGTTGGLVSLQAKRPQLGNDFMVAEAGVGTEDYYRATIDANFGLGENFGVRLNALYHNADIPGRDHVDSERRGIAASVLWQPVEALRIAADYYGYRLDGMSDYGHPFDAVTQRPYAVDADNFYGAVGRDFLDNGSDVGTLSLQFEPSEHCELRTTLRYGETWNYYVVSVPRAPVLPNAAEIAACFPADRAVVRTGTPQRHGDNRTFAFVQDATLRFDTGGVGHTLVAGFELSREQVVSRRYAFPATIEDANGNIVATPGGFTRDLFDPNPVLGFRIPAVLDPAVAPTVVKVDSMAAYLIDTAKFSPKWQANFGLRFDTFDIRATGPQGATTFDRRQSIDFLNGQASLFYTLGVELSVSGNITPRWSLFGGYTYLDAKIVRSATAANVGSRFPNVPRHNFSLLSSYHLTEWLTLGGQAYYQSKLHGGAYASTTATAPGYWRFARRALRRSHRQRHSRQSPDGPANAHRLVSDAFPFGGL